MSAAIPIKSNCRASALCAGNFLCRKESHQRKLSVPRQICHRQHGQDFSMRHPAASKNGAHPVRRPLGLRFLGGSPSLCDAAKRMRVPMSYPLRRSAPPLARSAGGGWEGGRAAAIDQSAGFVGRVLTRHSRSDELRDTTTCQTRITFTNQGELELSRAPISHLS